jgi:hypothetical protein
MNGVFLGRGRIDTSKNIIQLRVEKENRDFVEWLADEFSNIGGKVVNAGDKVEFRTGRFDWVETWHDRWYYVNKKVIPANLSLSPLMAGVWFHERGSVNETHGRLKLNVNGMRDSVPNARKILKKAGFETFISFGHIEMREGVTKEFLGWRTDITKLF